MLFAGKDWASYFHLVSVTEWCKEYSQDYVVKEDFQKEIDEFMASYDEKVQEVSYEGDHIFPQQRILELMYEGIGVMLMEWASFLL